MLLSAGPAQLHGSVAYCSQVPWIMAATLRDNITFGLPYDAERFAKVIDACALQQDLSELPGADLTEIGERGINLSGQLRRQMQYPVLLCFRFSISGPRIVSYCNSLQPRVRQQH